MYESEKENTQNAFISVYEDNTNEHFVEESGGRLSMNEENSYQGSKKNFYEEEESRFVKYGNRKGMRWNFNYCPSPKGVTFEDPTG